MNEIAHIEAQLQEASVAVDAADMLMGQGQIIDLNGLEHHVDGICATIAKLPPARCAGLKPALIMLIDGLNGLARKLSEQHDAIAGRLQGLSSHGKAATAYSANPTKPGRSRDD